MSRLVAAALCLVAGALVWGRLLPAAAPDAGGTARGAGAARSLVGRSTAMRELTGRLARVAPSGRSLLVGLALLALGLLAYAGARQTSLFAIRRIELAGAPPQVAAQVRRAFEEWDVLQLPIQFAFVDDSADAEVHVTWIDHFSEPISGRTKWARDDEWLITDANIILAVHHHQGEVLDEEAMRAMALHEIGHLLGLDHTQDATSIMAPKVRVRDLSAADRATVRLLYSLPPGPVR